MTSVIVEIEVVRLCVFLCGVAGLMYNLGPCSCCSQSSGIDVHLAMSLISIWYTSVSLPSIVAGES